MHLLVILISVYWRSEPPVSIVAIRAPRPRMSFLMVLFVGCLRRNMHWGRQRMGTIGLPDRTPEDEKYQTTKYSSPFHMICAHNIGNNGTNLLIPIPLDLIERTLFASCLFLFEVTKRNVDPAPYTACLFACDFWHPVQLLLLHETPNDDERPI